MVFTPNKRKAWSNDFILSKILLSLIWVTFLYLGLNFGIWHRNRKTVHVHSIDIGNSVADASSNQDNFFRSYLFLHAYKVLKGFKRVPILLLKKTNIDLKDICLDNYEISLVECMHDIAYHIDSIFEELPHHLSRGNDSEIFKTLLSQLNDEKQKKKML